MDHRICTLCKIDKCADAFSLTPRGTLAAWCKPCKSARNREYEKKRRLEGKRRKVHRAHHAAGNEELLDRRSNLKANQRFALLMRRAIASGDERATWGTVTEPSTQNPRFVSACAISSCGSPAQMCVEIGDPAGGKWI